MKTFKFLKYIGSLIVVFAIITSCGEDFLVEEPKLLQSNELALSDFSGLENATAGAYSLLCGAQWYGLNMVIVPDLKGGNAKRSPISSGRFADEYVWVNDATNTLNLWTSAYDAIARANNVINTIDDGFEQPGITVDQLNQLKGEALFLRALAHFDMVRVYAQPYAYATRSGAQGTEPLGVPYVTVTELEYPSRNTVEEVYANIIADLTSAIALLPVTVNREGQTTPKSWASEFAAQALLARVYLYKEDWQNAADAATAVIGSGEYSLMDTTEYTTWDLGGYWGSIGDFDEIIFQVDGSENNSAHGYWESIPYLTDPSGYGDIAATEDLTTLYEAGDIRGDLFRNTEANPDAFWPTKYASSAGGRLGAVPAREFTFPVLRLAEMYLIRAEAQLNGATVAGTTALDDYNELRENRGLSAAEAVTINELFDERRRELNFEGHLLFDFARLQRDIVRTDFDGTVNKDIPFPDYRWAMAIPQAEMDANENMTQNDDY